MTATAVKSQSASGVGTLVIKSPFLGKNNTHPENNGSAIIRQQTSLSPLICLTQHSPEWRAGPGLVPKLPQKPFNVTLSSLLPSSSYFKVAQVATQGNSK